MVGRAQGPGGSFLVRHNVMATYFSLGPLHAHRATGNGALRPIGGTVGSRLANRLVSASRPARCVDGAQVLSGWPG